MDASKDVEVAKTNALTRASYRLTLVEQQMVSFAIAWARDKQIGLDATTPMVINASEFAKTFGIAPQNVNKQLQDGLDGLFDRWIGWHSKDSDGSPRYRRTRWISEAANLNDAGEIEFVFAPTIIEHITRLDSGFTTYQLKAVAQFTSIYAIRLFELLMRFKKTGWLAITLQDLRFSFGLMDGEYDMTADFKRKVIKVALKQINASSPWIVEAFDVKKGRTITGFKFRFRPIPPKDIEPKEKPPEVPPFNRDWIGARAETGESWDDAEKRLWPIYRLEVLKIDPNQGDLPL
jgi:plasmid replication initiation protein